MPAAPVPGTTDRRIDALLTLLSENPMIVISGQKIAREIGVSRSAVWQWTQRLRALGVRVKGHPRSGYQIERVPDVLSPTLLRRQLRSSLFGKHIHHFFKAGSTNAIAFDLGRAGEPQGAVVLAEEQSAGRGRAGRSWHSEKTSGIYVTVLLRPAISPLVAPLITLLAGLAVRDAVLEETGPRSRLALAQRLADGREEILRHPHGDACGARSRALRDRGHRRGRKSRAACPNRLRATPLPCAWSPARSHSRLQMLVRLLRNLETYYNRFLARRAGSPSSRASARRRAFARGKRVRISTAAETYTGTTDGLEPNGLLRVRRDDGRLAIVTSGDVAEAN
jgi:BirA family biotin operon repressor/biotin-[acetyl-CoA-carboxylase] ligase